MIHENPRTNIVKKLVLFLPIKRVVDIALWQFLSFYWKV